MDLTLVITKVVGPVLLLRAVSIVIDRDHFIKMLRGLESEASTVSFSMFPIALLMICITLANFHKDTSSVAALLIHAIIWGGILKASALIVLPKAVAAKAHSFERAGMLNLVLVMCFAIGGYFTWFGYFAG